MIGEFYSTNEKQIKHSKIKQEILLLVLKMFLKQFYCFLCLFVFCAVVSSIFVTDESFNFDGTLKPSTWIHIDL